MVNKSQIDVSQVFLCFMALCGDVEKCSLALDIPEATIRELAENEGWNEKVRRISVMSKSTKPGEWERATNRALSFVQGYQLRKSLDRVVAHIATLDAAEIIDKQDAHGNHTMSARLLTDLAKAMQTVHEVCYSALGDSVKERAESDGSEGTAISSAALHASLIGALNAAKLGDKSPVLLVNETVDKIAQLKSAATASTDTSL